MGKNLKQQRRGKGTHSYRSLGFRFKGRARYPAMLAGRGEVKDILKCPGHTAPLLDIRMENGDKLLTIGSEGICVGQTINIGETGGLNFGDVAPLAQIPSGTMIFNIESRPGDGGKFVRAAGTFAKLISKTDTEVMVRLPSKKVKGFNPMCRATIGRVAGSGRTEKPFVKAGKRYHKIRAVGGIYPRVSGVSMNAVDHPFGGSSSAHKGRPTIAPKNAPPGRKVGKLRPRRTGKRN